MIKSLIRKELLTAFRDTRLQVAGLLLIGLMITAVVVGKQGQKRIQAEREAAQSEMYSKWVNQGDKHPHSAAHYGQFAFKPKPVLSFLDVGLDNYTGISVFLEAHKQNEVLFSAAQDSNSMTRFGELTVAVILQTLIPLLIIFLAFNTFSKEREEGTLKLNVSQGLSMKQIFTGKVLGTYLMILIIYIPVALLAYVMLDDQSGVLDQGATTKFLVLILGYAVYFLIFILLSVLVSAFSKNSGYSLLTMLGCWIVFCIVVPKASASLADRIYPTPSQFEFRSAISEKVANGIDGHNPSDIRLAALKEEVLNEYGVDRIEDLPVNWSGIAMQAGEEYTDQVYDQEFSRIEGIFHKQNRVSEWVGFLNPYLAIRHLSMALSGTDFSHHVAFSKAAEDYRRRFVKKMNRDMEINHKPDMEYDEYKVGEEMWASIEPFSYQLPQLTEILREQWRSLMALTLWVLGLMLISMRLSHKISKL